MAKYMIPNEFPSDLYDFAKPHAQGQWTSYPTYSYEQFYRANPRGKHNPADPKARYKALQAVADDERANENERKIARRLMAKMEAEGLVKPKKAKKNGKPTTNALLRRLIELDEQCAALEAQGAKIPKSLHAEVQKVAKAYKREASRGAVIGRPNSHHARRNSGEPVFIPVAGNAGRFTPNIFPYGVGGRPAIYPADPAAKGNPRRKRRELDTEAYRAAWETTRPRYTDSSPDELIRHRLEAAKLLRKHHGKSDAEVAKALGFDPREPGIVAKIKELRGDFYRTNPRPGKYKVVLEAGGKFAIPEKAPREGSFPIDTIKRARYALAIVASPSFDEKPSIRQRVIKAVVAEYPQLQTEADHVQDRVESRLGKKAAANPRRRR